MTKEELMIAAKEFLADHDYAETNEGLTCDVPAGFEAQMLIEHFAQFAYEMIEMEEDRIRCDERLLSERLSAAAFKDGFSMIKGTDCWIGSDSCEYDGPLDYVHNGSPLAGKRSFMLEG